MDRESTLGKGAGLVLDLGTEAWEASLLTLAREGSSNSMSIPANRSKDRLLLDHAYAHCERVTAEYSRSFHMASGLLPRHKRRAARALYAFCRVTDNIVDGKGIDPLARLESWKRRALSWDPPEEDLVAVAWADARASYAIPEAYAEQLIEGVARDLKPGRYESFDELAAYAYGVASTVGLMSMHITGFSGPEAIPYAVKMGVALQLTNILRDVGEDWRAGRLYLPEQELAQFGLGEADIAAGQVDDRWRAFMRFNILRNHQLYEESMPGVQYLDPDGQFAIGAAADLYRAILTEIERNDYNVFSRRAHVSRFGKVRRLPAIWWRSRFGW